MEIDLQKLAQQIRTGNEQAFGMLFNTYYKPLVFYALRIVKSTEIAEELVQELFCRVWEKREEIIIEQSFKAYLYGAIRLNCLRYLRDTKLRSNKLAEKEWVDFVPADQLSDRMEEDIYFILEKTLASLPEKTSEIFRLNRFEGLKYREIAEQMAISEKTVEAHMSSALKTLRETLREFVCLLPLFLSVFK
jgi:RNA polymerase sigma-70 factor (ECF subfamily)